MSLGNSPQKSEQKSEQTRIQENMSPLREMVCHPVRGDLASAGIIDLNSAESDPASFPARKRAAARFRADFAAQKRAGFPAQTGKAVACPGRKTGPDS